MRVSDWYTTLSYYTFPTLFIHLQQPEIDAIVKMSSDCDAARKLIDKMHRVVKSLPGKSFVHADCCAPTDAAVFGVSSGAVATGAKAWDLLVDSIKVRDALRRGDTVRLGFHPYRRMKKHHEFRMFVRDRVLVGMSQLYVDRYHHSLHRNSKSIWRKARALCHDVADLLPVDDVAIDVYLTSVGQLMIIDLNKWGPPTDPLLLRDWDRDWTQNIGLKLVPKPMIVKGDVEVSF